MMMRRTLLVLLYVGLLSWNGFGQDSVDKIRKEREKALREIDYSNKLLNETIGKTKESLNEINIINHKLKKRRDYLNGLELEVNVLSEIIDENSITVNEVKKEISRLQDIYASIIVSLYKKRSNNYYIMYFLASENINQLYKRIRFIRIYNNYLKNQTARLAEMEDELITKNEELNKLVLEKNSLMGRTRLESAVIAQEVERKRRIVQDLKKKENEIKNEIREKEKTARKLENELKKIIAEERARIKKTNAKENYTPEERIISSDFEKNKGRLPWPTQQGIITGQYGEHDHPDYKSVKIRNDGVYIATTSGELARTIFKGVVSRVFAIPGENYTVIIKHGNYYTLYHNLVNVRVKAGQNVEIKEILGNVFTNVKTKETTLYFQVWKETERSDPELWLVH
ncbi:MAG TPA: peptidoglycan DD-metalloendopeptidase family protein [Bacteroidales bacterium]|nr:peptidoglycan DD-metalloendopeptidase family protein [Bacteroidales bacterium]